MQKIYNNICKHRILIFSLLFLLLFSGALQVFAIPPASPYVPGDAELNPNCAPGDPNCYVAVGTVTSVSVTPANGISGVVATGTTTPAITLTLGEITPTTVNGLTLASAANGFTIAGGTTPYTLTVPLTASVSGTNTGDQDLSGLVPYTGATTNVDLGVFNLTAPTIYGGDLANEDLTLEGTSHATKTTSYVLLQPTSGNVGIGTAAPDAKLDVSGRMSINGYSPRLYAEYKPTESIPSSIDTTTYDAFGITSQFPTGKLVIVYRQGSSHVGAGDYGIIRMRTSTNNGKTWSSATTITSESNVDLRNVGGGVTPNGRLVVLYGRYNPDSSTWLSIVYIYSDDEGVTWSSPTTLSTGSNTAYSPHGGLIPIADGKVLANWYGDDGTAYTSYVIISSDNGKTWGSPISVITASGGNRYSESSFIHVGGGEILGLIRINNGTVFRQVKSTDNGTSWTDQGNITFDSWTTPSPPWLSTFQSLSGRRMVAAYYVNRTALKLRVILGTAKDLIASGVSAWQSSTRQDIATTPNIDSAYPSVIHPLNSPYAIGWYYYTEAADDADIAFFTWPTGNSVWGEIALMGGNVGIGLTPVSTNKLDILQTSTTTLSTGLNILHSGAITGTGYGGYITKTGASTVNIGLQVSASGGTANYGLLVSAGNVGIGTTTPGYKLEIGQVTSTTGANSTTTGSTLSTTNLFFRQRGAFAGISGAQYSNQILAGNGAGDMEIYNTSATANLVFGANSTEWMRIKANGNVGIGTVVPSGILSVTPTQYSTGTASQALTTVTGVGTTFTSAMVGSQLVYANGVSAGTITAFTNATTLTVSTSQTVASQAYNIAYTGLQVGSTGNVGIGTTTPSYKLHAYGDVADYVAGFVNDGNLATHKGILVQAGLDDQAAAGPSTLIQFNDGDGTSVGSITFGSSVTAYNTSSDERLKENITDTILSLNDLNKIKIHDFTWKADSEHKISHGIIAQELYEIYPGAITKPIDETKDFWMVDYSKLSPLIIKSIQELDLKINDLTNIDTPLLDENDEKTFVGKFFDRLVAWFGDVENGIEDFYVSVIHSDKVETKMLCVGTTCVTEEQFLEIVNKNVSTPAPDPDPPTCEELGNCPPPEDPPTCEELGNCPPADPPPILEPETCSDGIQNQDETEIDTGGICTSPAE